MSFTNFLADMGEKPDGMTIERLDVDGDYEPNNCEWADRTAQSRNRRYTKLTMELADEIRRDRATGVVLTELSRRYGVSVSQVFRVVRGEAWV